MKKALLVVLLNALTLLAFTQNYNISNGSTSTCSGNFYDSGGSGGNYGNSQTFVYTICPSTAGSKVRVNFTAFDLENSWDFLEIFDGNTTGAPSLGAYTGTTGPGIVQATPGNATGCLTFRFTSDGSGTRVGWAGVISCVAPCQTITANFLSSTPAASGGIIKICPGQSVNFTGSGTFSSSGAGAVYTWNFGDGTSANGTSVNHTFGTIGSYQISLVITDPAGCRNNNTIGITVQAATTPIITTTPTPASICLGQSSTLSATATPVTFTPICTPPVSGTTFLPDGSGVSYSTSIAVNCYNPAQTITAASQIQSVCLDLEHSYLGDLNFSIVCPNGQSVLLKAYPGGSNTYLGCPLDDPAVGPGTPRTYCFTPGASTLLVNGTTSNCGTPSSASINAGNYMPVQPFTNLIGCPLNGNWTIQVTDNLGLDNGYIFNWDVNFDPALTPSSASFTPTITSQGFVAAAGLTNVNSTTATVTPTSTGNHCYTYSVTDNFGCTNTKNVCVNVTPGTIPTFAAVGPYCSGAVIPNLPTTSTNGVTGTWSPAINNTATTLYTFTPTAGLCASPTTLTITINPKTTPTFAAVGPYCSGSAVPNLPTTSTNGVTGTWAPAINNTNTTLYTFTPTAGLCANTTTLTITINPQITPTFTAVTPKCTGSAIPALPTTSTNGINGTWSPAINNTATTTYTFTPAAGQCATTTTMTITITSSITPTFAAVGSYCSGVAIPALPTTSTNGINGTWSPAINNTTTTTYTFTPAAGQCATTTTLTITVNPNITPTFTGVPAKCSGAVIAALPTTSNNGINGTWSPAINNTATTLYTFTPTAGQCATNTTMTITVNPLPVPTAVADSVNCNGGSTGSVTVTGVTSSVGPYTYSWNSTPVQNTQTAIGLPIGTYTVTVQDQNTGCTGQTTVTISQPLALTATENHVNPTCAQGTNGTATANPAGGTAPYSYSWNTTPIQLTKTATGLAAGSYTCTITDYNGCTTTTTAVLVDPAGMVLSSSMTQANCGASDGSATVSVTSGGSGNFSYSWNTTPVQNTATATAIPSNTYIVTVTDVTLGCISKDTIFVTTTTGITATAVLINDALCNGSSDGKAYAFPTGGSPIYTYSWNTTPVQTTDTVTAGAGTYTVTITDGFGCSGTANVTIGQPTVVVASITGSTNEICLGANNGTATAGGTGGSGTYTYSWNTVPVQTTQTATGLTPGTYIATVYDANLCSSTANITINPGPAMTASHTSTNVSCFGGTSGTITETILGAAGAITYNWMPGSIGSQNPVGLAAGTYYLTATSMGCSVNDTVIITQPTQLIASIDSTKNVVCNGGSDGQTYGSATGGTGALNYSWSTTPVQNTASAIGLPVGTYTLTVTDANLCTSTINAIITQPAPLAVNTGSIDAYCGVNQGTVWASPTNGTSPYIFIWDSSSVVLSGMDTLRNLYPGSYHIQVLDANGCKFVGDVIVNAAPGGSAMISATNNVSCFGGSNGTATVSMSGAFPPYTYQWDAAAGNQTTNPATGLALGTYGVNITDAYGCVMATSANITQPTQLTLGLTQNNTVCPNSCDGTATATPAGGTSPYFYSWNDPSTQITSVASSLCLGTFTVQVTDSKGCNISDSIVINNPPAMELDSIVVPANCNQADGSAEVVIVSNGTGPYTFSWTDGVSTLSMTNQLSNVVAGTYFVTVTDFNLCSVTTPVTIPNLAGPQIDSTNFSNVLCFGDNNGTASVSVSGGTTPYVYAWNDALLQTTPTATNLIAGTYTVNVTDDNGCNLSTTVTVNQPADVVLTTFGVNPTCNGYSDGFVYVNAIGGVMPYTYSWNDPLTQANDSAINLPTNVGGYTVTVIDNNGCVKTENVVLTDPALFTINVTGTPTLCFGDNNGTATVAETNGVSPFTYLWDDPSAQTSQTASSLTANTYNVVATDDDGCIANGSIIITEPPLLTITQDTVLDVSCNGFSDGYANVNVSGGSGAYSYTWELGATLVSTQQSPNNLAAGTYLVTVTDANLCNASILITVNEPSPISAVNVAVPVLCAGGNSGYAYVTASGGVSPYTYQWDAAAALQQTDTAFNLVTGTYSVVVTDSNGCTLPINGIFIDQPQVLSFLTTTSSPSTCGSNNGGASVSVGGGSGTLNYEWNSTPAQFTAVATNLIAGNYTVVVTDQNGCKDSTNVNVIDLGSPTVTIPTSTNVSCNGAADGTATGLVSGGAMPYTYTWNTIPAQTTLTATGLNAQTYSLTVKDSNNCTASASIVIHQANALVAVIGTPTNVSCNGLTDGAATVMVAGGIAPFTYLWNDVASQATSTVSNIGAGTYIVQVADSNNCLALDTVTITEPLPLVVGLDSLKHVNCFGGSDGFIDVNATGGTFPYTTYTWTPNVSSGQAANGLTQGSYNIVITDNNGCTASNTFVVNEPLPLSLVLDSIDATCGNSNGSATVTTTSGGTSPYTYSWNDPSNQQTITASNLTANNYSVTVSDSKGCNVVGSILVNNLSGPVIDSIVKTNVKCFGGSDGAATAYVTGGAGLSYAWTPSSQITPTASALVAGVYSLTVTDVNGCSITQGGVNITQPFALTANITVNPSPACYGQAVQISANGNSGTAFAPPHVPYDIFWVTPLFGNGSGPFLDTVFTQTTYTIVVTDANGCQVPKSVNLNVGPALDITALDRTICQGDLIAQSATTTGGNSSNPLVYNWFVKNLVTGNTSTPPNVVNPSTNVLLGPTLTTNYMVYVSDGCSMNDTAYFQVVVNDTSIVTFNPITPDCPILYAEFKPVSADVGLTYSWDFDGDGIFDQTTSLDTGYWAYNTSGIYDVALKVTNSFNCKSIFYSPKHVTVYNVPTADFSADPQIVTILNPEINFTDLSSPDVIEWNWNFGDLTTDLINQNPIHVYQDTGYYPVQLIVTNGYCLDTIIKFVRVKPDFFFAIPNTFTPDGDRLNELFMPGSLVGVSEKDYSFYIFDRWGEKIWEGHDIEDGWDGTVDGGSKIAQTDTYVWIIKLKGIDGIQREYRGHVNILK